MAPLRISSFPQISQGSPDTAIGGDQAWLKSPLSRRTCCGGISLVNVLCSLTGLAGPMSREKYLDLYRSCLPHVLSGYIPFAWLYALRLRRLLRARGVEMRVSTLGSLSASPARALEVIRQSLSLGCPLALQNWFGCTAPVRRFHWVTVIGLEGEDPQTATLLVSSWGRVYRYPLSSCWRGKASLVTVKFT